jgi:hypothetical protein
MTQITPVAIQAIEDGARRPAAQRSAHAFDGGPNACLQNVRGGALDLSVSQVLAFLTGLAV